MREFTKSMLSYTWASSVFGMQQMLNLFATQWRGEQHPATECFNNVARCTAEQFGDTMRAVYRAGDNIQRGVFVDGLFSVLALGVFDRGRGGFGGGPSGGGWGDERRWGGERSWGDVRGYGRQATEIGRQTADAFQQGARAMGRAANLAGQAMSGAAPVWGCGGGGPRQEPTGWGPMPPPPRDPPL
jgi:hypothetical protein